MKLTFQDKGWSFGVWGLTFVSFISCLFQQPYFLLIDDMDLYWLVINLTDYDVSRDVWKYQGFFRNGVFWIFESAIESCNAAVFIRYDNVAS